jgi:hypothetical protein
MTFAEQPSLTELGVGSMSSSTNGGPTTVDAVSLSFTLWRNPSDHDDPVNLADITDEMRRSLEQEPVRALPEWLLERRRLMRYPALWEAVTTTRIDGERTTLTKELINHTNHILMNSFREERVVGSFPGELDSPVDENQVEYRSLLVDGVATPGIHINTDPHVFGFGVFLGDRLATAVIPRTFLDHINPALATRKLG